MKTVFHSMNSIYPMSEGLTDYLEKTMKEKSVAKREYLLVSGKMADHIYFITKGILRGYYKKEDTEVSAWFMKEDDVCISVESFLEQKASNDFIQALEPTVVYYISYDELQHIYQAYPEFNYISRVLMERYYRLSEERLYMLRMHSGRERYDYLLAHYPDLVRRVPQKYLASYLDLTEVALSQIRSKKY